MTACICVYAIQHPRETRVLEHHRCPEHGHGGGVWRVVGLPPWVGEAM